MSKVHTTGNGKLKKEFKPKNITNKRIQNNIANINWEWESSSSYIYDGKVGKQNDIQEYYLQYGGNYQKPTIKKII